ncbi:MAG: hypothetical protein ABW292_02455, partial [Vicinamibacterales bacterium]
MKAHHLVLSLPLAALVALVAMQSAARAQSKPAAVPDITGSWERHGFGPGARAGGPRDEAIPPPAPQPQLKPQYAKEWQDRIMAGRAADAKG